MHATPTDFRDARVLVTGARGFLGRHLCRTLVQAGAIVIGVSRVVHPHAHVRRMNWSVVDMTDLVAVQTLVREAKPDIAFHLAGHVTGSQSVSEVQPTFGQNLATTVHLLTSAQEAKTPRIVLAGSMHEPQDGDPPTVPCSPYAASKTACTAYARMFHALYSTPVVVARPMMVYGPGQWDVRKLLPYVVTSMLRGTQPAVASGTRMLDWVYVKDVINGLMKVGSTAGLEGLTIDLGTGSLVSVRSIVDRVAAITGASVPVAFGAVPDRLLEIPRAARTARTRELIGWQATTSLGEGLRKTIEWWRQGAADSNNGEIVNLAASLPQDASISHREPFA
jgi:nucleoside-diphosphate-sugar epimerase